MRRPAAEGPCPCGRAGTFGALTYTGCCARFLDTDDPAPDAESLMRSRYTAYALGRTGYLLATWDVAHRPERLDDDPSVTWLGLTVLDRRARDDDHAEVEFVARYRGRSGPAQELHERSRFVRRDGRWYYVTTAP